MEWFIELINAIGTEIISAITGLILGGLGGGAIGYRIANKSKANQTQKARDNANQSQIGNVTINSGGGRDE